jgi:hypothetical protein
MSDLRNQLEQAKSEYRSLRYPGDLANQIAPPQSHRLRWLLPIAVAAAALLVAVHLMKTSSTALRPVAIVATTQGSSQNESISLESLAPPTDMSLAPPACEFDFTSPSLSFSDDPEKTSTTQESV